MKVKMITILVMLVSILTMSTVATSVGAQMTWHVYSGGSIQTVIDGAADGDTIVVHAAIYTEQLNIYKALTVTAEGVVVVQSPASPVTIGTIPGSSRIWQPVVRIHDTAGPVSFSGFVVDGNSRGTATFAWVGIFVYQAQNVLIRNNEVKNIYPVGGFSGAQTGIGIAVYPGATSAMVTLRGNNIHDYNKGGIVVNNNGASAAIIENTVTGHGETDIIAQNGIQMGFEAKGEIRGNTITGNWYQPVDRGGGKAIGQQPWVAAGILLIQVDMSDIKVSNNELRDNQFNMLVIPA